VPASPRGPLTCRFEHQFRPGLSILDRVGHSLLEEKFQQRLVHVDDFVNLEHDLGARVPAAADLLEGVAQHGGTQLRGVDPSLQLQEDLASMRPLNGLLHQCVDRGEPRH
jgi:hypothetical protein